MSAPAANVDATSKQGEFSASVPPSEPLMTSGHQPGRNVSEDDAAPVFHAQAIPAGSAPEDSTFAPNTTAEVPAAGAVSGSQTASAGESIAGATSASVHTGLGKPGQGMSSVEQHHDGKTHRAKERSGLEGTAATSAKYNKDVLGE